MNFKIFLTKYSDKYLLGKYLHILLPNININEISKIVNEFNFGKFLLIENNNIILSDTTTVNNCLRDYEFYNSMSIYDKINEKSFIIDISDIHVYNKLLDIFIGNQIKYNIYTFYHSGVKFIHSGDKYTLISKEEYEILFKQIKIVDYKTFMRNVKLTKIL